jgi:hypothetical protein
MINLYLSVNLLFHFSSSLPSVIPKFNFTLLIYVYLSLSTQFNFQSRGDLDKLLLLYIIEISFEPT